jgi:hypothetical protein
MRLDLDAELVVDAVEIAQTTINTPLGERSVVSVPTATPSAALARRTKAGAAA